MQSEGGTVASSSRFVATIHSGIKEIGLIILASVLPLLFFGCAGSGDYWNDRANDLPDIFDFKCGSGVGLVGAKVEITDYIGTGLGLFVGSAREKYGREIVTTDGIAIWLGIFGGEGISPACQSHEGYKPECFCLLYHFHGDQIYGDNSPPLTSRFRFGGEVFLFFPWLGFYINLGELVDFVVGFTTLDIAGDDKPPPELNSSSGGPLERLTDKKESRSSSDLYPYFWRAKGGEQWVSQRFHEPEHVSWTEVYWHSDPKWDSCVPESWQLLWLDIDGETWRPVVTKQAYGMELDKYNRVEFEAVKTLGIKLVVQLKDGLRGGIHRWKYGD